MKMTKLFSLLATLVCATTLSAATLQSLVTNEQDGAVIIVPNGTYEPSNLANETRKLTFRAESDGGVIIDGGNTARCVDLSETITLEGFVLQNGKADRGGGVRGGTIIRTTIQNCSATFGGGSYQTRAYVSTYKGNTAEFFGMAAYGGTLFSCRVESNNPAAYGDGMGALFGVTVANTSVTGNTALRDNAGALVSSAENMVYFGNTAPRGLYQGAPMTSVNTLGSEAANVVADENIFTNAAAGDYTLNVNAATPLIKDKGDGALGGHYDALWYGTDLSGRPRLLGLGIDIGPYEIADTFTVTCNVVGVGSATVSPNFIQEGDPVTLTAQQDANYAREFLGFYVNGELISPEASCTYNPVSTDKIEARFAGLSATTETLADVLTQLHPTIREEVKLADGTYTINGLTKPIAFVGSSIGGTTITLSDDCKGSFFINATVTGTASNATLHRSLATNFSGSDLTLTSSIITSDCGTMSGTAVNVTAYTTMPTDLACTDCVTLPSTANTVVGAILPKGDAYIDAGQGSTLTPYDALDIAGRPRKMGSAIDCGAHECHYITLTVAAEGYYQTLTPAVGTYEKLAGETLVLAGASPRTFKGWTLGDGTVVSKTLNGTYVLPEKDVTLTAVFAGFAMNPGDTVPSGTQAGDTITLAPGTYTQDFTTAAKIVGTGKQDEVILTGSITNATLEAVTLQNATLSGVTLNRCFVDGGTIANGTAYNSILVNVTSVTGTYINNTTVNTTLPNTAKNTRATTEGNYTPTQEEADKGGSLTVDERNALGDYDYYGNPRVNNGAIDAGAVEYVWPPYVVTINVIGHGLVEPRGAVEVVRGETLTFTVAEDPKHPRGTATVTGAELVDGLWTITPSADSVVTVTFPGLTVDSNGDLAAVVAEAQHGETITVAPGTYGAIDVKGKRVKIVASSSNPYDTIIDAQGATRAVKLAEGAEIIGFTIQNGLSNEGAGVYGGTVRRSVIRWNKLTYNGFGAGVCNTFAESCLIVDNGSTSVERSNGGGAANSELLNCTVVRNVADKGAGLYDCTAKNAVIALNVDLTGATSDWTGDSVEPDPTDCCTPTTGGIAVDAANLFVDAANNDWRLREGIACVNAGKADDRLSVTDLTGAVRIYGGTVDMGAIEWNAPDRKVKISLQGRGMATVSYTKNSETISKTVMWGTTDVLSVPHGTDTLTLSWTEDSVERALAGITADGVMIANSATAENADFSWTLVTRDTVNVDLVFVAEELTVNTDDTLTAALASAIPGETIHVAEGTYAAEVPVGAGVTLDGDKVATLTGGVTLADGAVLKNMTVTTNRIVGPESGAATVLHSVVTEVNGTAIYRNVIVKASLIHNNRGSGVMDATVYLSTIVNNLGQGVMGTSKCYGSIISNNGADVENTVTVVDSIVGGDPRFVLPAPDGDDYTLMSSSPAIDAAKTAQWEGFTDADRALTDLEGNPRPRLGGFDAGAYEVQGEESAATTWTWYGSDYTMDGYISGAHWRKMSYGAPSVVPAGENVTIGDRPGYLDATLFVDGQSSFGNVSINNVNTALRIADAGGTWNIESLANKTSAGALTLAAKMNIWSAFAQGGAGRLNIEPGAAVTIGGTFTVENTSAVTQTGGSLTVPSGNNTQMWNWSTYTIKDGQFNFGNDIYIHNNSTMVVEGGEVTGNRISIAQGDGRTPLKIYGGNITVTRLETGDTSGARHGNVEQMGGTVTLTGSNSEKQAPLHISHWPGSSTYTLRGGELYVPNGEVRLGRDGSGTLRLEGGIARLKRVEISNGRVQLAGGTYEALAATTTLTAEVERGTISTIRSCEGDTTGLTLNLSNTGDGNVGTVNLVSGYYKGTINAQNVMLGAGVVFTGTVDHSSGLTLTLPGDAMAEIKGTYVPKYIQLSSEPTKGERQAILKIYDSTGTTSFATSDVTLTGAWASCCTVEVVKSSVTDTMVYVTRNSDPEITTTAGTPTITVNGDTTWSDATKWSYPFTDGCDAIVRVVASGTLNIDTEAQVGTLTFDVPEGLTLNMTAATWSTANEVKKTGLGTLKWSSQFSYDMFNEGEGTFIAAANGQTFTGKAFETMAFRAEANVTLSGQTRVNVKIPSNGATLTLTPQGDVLDGSITVEAGGTLTYINAGKTFTFIGDFVNNWGSYPCLVYPYGNITLAGNTTLNNGGFYMGEGVRLAGNVKINSLSLASLPYKYFVPGLKTFDVGSLNLTMGSQLNFLNNQWPNGATKVGAGTLTFPAGYGFGGSAAFSGPVVFTESLEAPGSLHFKSDAVVTIPYGCTLTANDEIRVEAGARFIITNPPAELDSDVLVKDFLISKKTAGLRVDHLATVSLAWGSAPDVSISNPIPSLNGDTLQYTITKSTVKTWTGANSSDWSDAGNWSGTGDAVLFTDAATQKSVTLSEPVSPSQMTIQSGDYTFTGGANLYAFEGKTNVTQYANAVVTWQTFFTRGSYMLHANATAKISVDEWTYAGSLSGAGAVQVTAGRLALTSASNGFVGSMTVDSDATLRLCNENALYNAAVTLKGALSVESPTSLATLAVNGGTLSLATDKPLEVRNSFTGSSLAIAVTDIAEVGDWTILTYPAATTTTFSLMDTIPADAGLVAVLTRTSTALVLSVRSNENIAWSEKRVVDSITKDIWVVDGTTAEIAATTNKHLNIHDVEGVDAVTVALPAFARSLTVTAQQTQYTLTGSLTNAPITVEKGAEFTLATSTTTPTAVKNEGVIVVTGTLDLTNATLSGYGKYVADAGGVIRIGAQAMAEATATFVRGAGQIIVVTDGDIALPDNRLPTEDGVIIKEGEGTLYLSPTAMTQPITINAGSVAPNGGMTLKARYFKFEPHERFTGSAWWLPATGLSDFVTTLSGERQAWPEGTKIVRFDSGVTNKIQIGVSDDNQSSITVASGTLNNLIDNDTTTELIWNEWHDSYGTGGTWRRNYFVVDAGEAGIRFTGYNVGTPTSLNDFFWHWSVAMANDISDWRPSTEDSSPTANEATIWQQLDDRLLPETTSGMVARSWMTPAGYSARRASGFWSRYTAPITLGATGTLDLTMAIGTSGILQDEVEIVSVTGDGTVMMPTSLKVTADTFTVETLKLVGSTTLRAPMTVNTTAMINNIVVSDSVAAAYNNALSTKHVLMTGYTGALPMLQGMTSPSDGGTWALSLVDGTLSLVLEGSQRELFVTLTEDTAWNEIVWCDALDTPVDYIDWSKVRSTTIVIPESAPDTVTVTVPSGLTLPKLPSLVVDYGQTTDKALALDGPGTLAVEVLTLTGEQRSAFLPRTKTVISCDTLDIALPKWDTSVPFIDYLGRDNQYTPPAIEMGICANGEETLRTFIAGSNFMALRSGTLRLTREEQFGVMTRDFRVDAGATLDVNGWPLSNNIILAGGTLTNTGNAIPSGKRQTYNISLTADSVVMGSSEHYSLAPGYAVHTLTLNGHTLTKRGSNTFIVRNANFEGGNGKIVSEGGTFKVETQSDQVRTMKNVEFVSNGGAVTITGSHSFEGKVTLGAGVGCANNVTLAANATLAGSGRFDANLTLSNGAVIEVTSAAAPVEVRGTLSPTPVPLRLGSNLTTVATAVPLISMPNLADKTTITFTLDNQPNATTMAWTGDVLYLVPEGMSSSVTEVKATVAGEANWSTLQWTDMSGAAVTPDWRSVTTATLTLTADATLTRDVATLALTSLTLTESEHTLTLEGVALPSTLTTLAANTEIVFGSGMVSTIPANLSGAKNLTFNSTVTSAVSGSETAFAYPNFTGNWIVESGATLNMNGGGGKFGVMHTTSEESGIITVKQGATINLNGGHAFGWGDTAAQRNRKVLVVDGGHVECSPSVNQYMRRTFEFKNGATLHSSHFYPAQNQGINFTRDANILVTEGEVTFTGYLGIGCDVGNSGQQVKAIFNVSEGATLKIAGTLKNGSNYSNDACNNYPVYYTGAGTIMLNGAASYMKFPTSVASTATLLINGSVADAKAYTIESGAGIGGSGTLQSVGIAFNENTRLAIVDKDDPLTLSVMSLSFPAGGVAVTPPAGVTMGNPAKLLKSNVAITANNFYLTESTGYALSVTQDSSGYTLLCNRDERDSYPELVADVTGVVAWDSIVWKTPEGTAIDSNTINWTSTETITLRVSNTATVQIPDNLLETFNRLETLQVAYATTDATLTLAGNTVSLPTVHVASGTGTLTSSATSLGIETLTAATASVGMDLSVCGSVTTLPETVAYSLIGNGTLGRVLPGTTDVTIASGTVTMGAAGQLANRRVIVKSGATLDVMGYAQPVSITLAGGTLTNTGAALDNQSAWQTYNITLTADSTISGSANIRSLATNWAGNTINLNGRTLTLDNSATVYLTNPTLNNGTIVVAAGRLDIGYGWDAANSWAQKDATSTLNNVTIQANGGSVIFNRNMAMEGTVVLGEGVKLKEGVALTESATTRLTLSANAFNGAATLTARDITLTANTLPTRYPAVNCTTLTLADDYKALIAASEAIRVQLATVSGDAPTVSNLPAGRTALVEGGVLYAAIPMSDLKATVSGEQSIANLAWQNAETGEALEYANIVKSAVTSMTLTVTGDTQLALGNLKTDFPRLTTLNIIYGAANATLTFAGDATTLPTVSITGEAGALATSTTLAIDALMVAQDTFTFDVNALNAVTTIVTMPSASTTLVGDATLTAQLPALSGRLTTNGTITISSALEGTVALTVPEGKTLTLSGSNSYTGATTIPSGATLVLTKEGALATGSIYKGAGTLSCSGFLPKGITSSLTANTWTGTVVITGTITLADQNTSFEALGHTNSKLVIDGNLTGYLKNNGVCEVPVELNGSLTNNNGYSNNSYVFKKLSGTGSFTHNKDLPYAFIFEDVSEFEGAITVSAAQARVVVGGTAAVENGKIVVAGNAKIASGKTWSANNGFTIAQDVTLTIEHADALSVGSGKITGAGTLLCNGVVPTTKTGLNDATTWTGTVTLKDITTLNNFNPNDYGNTASTVELYNMGSSDTTQFYFPGSSATYNPTLKLTGTNYVRNGSQDKVYTFNKLTGDGSLTINNAPGNGHAFVFVDASEFSGALNVDKNTHKMLVGSNDSTLVEAGKIVVAGNAVIAAKKIWQANQGIKIKPVATIGGEGTLGSAVTFEDGATLDLTKGVLMATNTVNFGATLKIMVDGELELDDLMVLKKQDANITEAVDIAGVKVAINGGEATYSLMQTSEGYILRAKTIVTTLTAKAGQSLSDVFNSADSILDANATLVINFGDVEGNAAVPGTFTFDNAAAVSFASITVQGTNGGTLLKTGEGAVTCTTFTRNATCTDLTLDTSLFSSFYAGNQTIEGWTLGLQVPAEATATLSNVFTVNSGATLKKVGEGTLALSSKNIFKDNAALQILEGSLHLNAEKESISGDILVATDATLKLTRNDDLINYNATNIIDIYGTLDLDSTRWTLKGGNTLNLYPGAQVIGLGQHHDNANGYYGALDWAGSGAIHVKANNSETGTATISANLRMRAGVTVEVEAGMKAIFTGTIYQGSTGQTLTKTGEGTMQYDFTVNPNSVAVTEGTLAGAGVIGNDLTMANGTTLALPAEGTLFVAETVTFGESLNITVAENVTLADKLIIAKADDSITEATLVNTRITVNGTNMDYYLVQTNAGYVLKTKEDVTTLSGTAGQSLSQLFNTATQKIGASATLAINFGDIEGETANPGTFTFDNATDVRFALVTITGSNGGALVKTGTGAVTADATSVTDTEVIVPAETATLGAVTIAEGAKLSVANTATVTSVTGEGAIELLAAAPSTNFALVKDVAFVGTAIATATGENGTVIENTDKVTWPSGKQYIFNGGTHALTFYPGALPNDKSTETEDSASIQVKANTTLTLKARDFGGWSGSHFNNIALSVKGENANVIAASFDDSNPGCFVGRVYLADGATIQGGDNNTDAINFFGNADDANIHVTSGAASWTNKLWIGDGGGGDITNLGVTVNKDATFNLPALVQNNKGIKKCGAGTMVVSGDNTSTGALQVTAGMVEVSGAWAGATTVAESAILSGVGTIGGTLTFTEGATLVVDSNAATPLMVNGAISGVAQLSFTGEVIQRTAVIASAQTIQTSSFVPPPGYTFAVETVDGVNTLYVTPAPITELVANLSGEMAWEDIEWMTPEGATVDISTIGVSQVATLTLNLEADAQLTFVDDVTEIFPVLTQICVDSELSSDVALTIRGNAVTLPTVKVSMHYAPMSFRSEATSLTVAKFQPFIMTEYGLGVDVAFLNSCTDLQLPLTYRLMGDGIVQKTLSGDVKIVQGKVTVGNELSAVTALSIEADATLKVTSKAALTNFLTSDKLALDSTTLTGAGTLELAFADADTILEMTGHGGTFTGDILVSSGTLKFPNGGENGPGKNRVITVTGANAALATGTTNDATGWSIAGRQSIVLTEQGEFKVYKRDTLKTPITMAGGIIRLMETAEDSGRGLDWFEGRKLTVNALEGASVASPTDSYITYVDGAAGAAIKMNIRDGSFPVEVNEKARLTVDVNLYGGELTKTGVGELVLTNAENSYGATEVTGGTLTVTGATGTGATTMAVGTTLRGTGTVKGDLTFTNTTETVEDVPTITGWSTFEVDVTTGAAPLTVTGTITGVAKLAFTGDIASLASIPVVISTQESVVDSFEGIPDGFTFTKVGNMHILVNENAQEYTALYAKVAGDTTWSQLTWTTDAEGTQVVTTAIAWDAVEAVTLTAAANATVTRDVTTAALTSLTVMDSEYPLTLAGYALPETSTLVVDGALCLSEGVVTTMPNLRGAGALTFMGGEIISTQTGSSGTNYAYNDFTGRWILENDTTLRIRGEGKQMGQLNWNSTVEGSGQIEVRQGARLVLEAQNVFGWGKVNELHQRKVLIVDGGEVEISTAENYIRRTIELKNGATLACPATNSTVYFSRGATIEVTEGEATISGMLNVSCDNAGSSVNKGATIRVDEGATLNLPVSIAYGKNGNTFALTYTGGGTVNVTGENTYHAYTETIVDEGMTFIMNGTHIAPGENTLKPYTFKAGATLMGSGTINGAVTFNEGAVVVADGQALTLGAVTAESTFVEVTATLDTLDATATVFSATNDFDVSKFSTPAAYVLEKTSTTVDEITTYALVVKRASTVSVTGTNAFNATTQQVLRDLVIDTLKAEDVTEGEYAVAVEVYTKGSETPKTPTADEVDALLGCFINVETVDVDTENNTATVKIEYEFGLAGVSVDANLNVIFTATVEGPTVGTADYVDGVSFVITDEGTQESWEIDAENIDLFNAPPGSVFLTLPDTYEVEGVQKSILSNFIGTRQFKVKVRK